MSDPSTLTRHPTRRYAPLLAVLLALALPALTLAATVGDLVALATSPTYNMQCVSSASDVQCTAPASRFHPAWFARITPASGQEDTLLTRATTGQLPLDATSRSWMIDMHRAACGGPKGAVDAFVNKVADLTKSGSFGPEPIGTCSFTGMLTAPGTTVPSYVVNSVFVPPSPTPTSRPIATPTLAPTAKPTAKPTPSPEPSLVAEATPSAAPSAAPSASLAPSPSPTPEPSESPAPPTAATTLAPVVTVAPSALPTSEPVGAGGPAPGPTEPAWEESVLAITDVNTDVGAAGGSLLLALLLLLLIGFIGELFNNTVENNYEEIAGWFRKGPIGRARAALGRIRFDPPGVPGVWLFIALTALISSFVDPGFGLNVRSIAVFLGFLVGLLVVLASFKLPPMLARKRKTGELGRLRPLPWALVIAALFVLVSRLANLQPGYLYGIVLGAIFVTGVSSRDEGRETFFGSIWTLAAAIVAWVALTWLRGLGLPEDGFGVTLLSTAFAATLVAGLEAAAFALMPLRFLPGYVIYKWNRPAWAILWGVSLFAFLHILIGPMSGYVSELSPEAFLAALGVFAAFGALSIGTWLYFRFRNPPAPETADAT